MRLLPVILLRPGRGGDHIRPNLRACLTNGDYQINVTQNGTAVPQTMDLTVHN